MLKALSRFLERMVDWSTGRLSMLVHPINWDLGGLGSSSLRRAPVSFWLEARHGESAQLDWGCNHVASNIVAFHPVQI